MSTITYPAAVTDVHAHVFNAKYLPVEGMLLRLMKVEDGDSKRFRRKLASWLRRFVVGITDSTISSTAMDARLRASLADGDSGDLSTEELLDLLYLQIVQSIEVELSTTALRSALGSATAMSAATRAVSASPMANAASEVQWMFDTYGNVEDEDVLDVAASQLPAPAALQASARRMVIASSVGSPVAYSILTHAALEWLIRRITKKMVDWLLDDGLDLLKFVHRMISSEEENVRSIFGSYAASQNVSQIVHMQLDMELAFPTADADPTYDLPTQAHNLQALSLAFPAKLRWFAGFDPLRHAAANVDTYCQSMRAQGCSGFKFYPPMGYRAAGNADAAIEASCDAFFAFCEKHDFPVFTHCTPKGFQARSESGVNGDPRYWELALTKHPLLRLCLGHAGGGRQKNGPVDSKGWVAQGGEWNSDGNWARRVVELCRTYKNVYCEFGHVDALIGESKKERDAFVTNFTRELKDSSGAFVFELKCMYGSDSVMPNMVRHTREFLEAFRQLFESAGFPQSAFDKFASQNAVAYLR